MIIEAWGLDMRSESHLDSFVCGSRQLIIQCEAKVGILKRDDSQVVHD